MIIVSPLTISQAMLGAGTTIPAVDTSVGEVAWVSGANHALKVERVYAGGIWSCVVAHSGRTTPPPNDPDYWEFKDPCNQMAPFDLYWSTPARAVTSLTYVVQMGFANALNAYGLVGTNYLVQYRAAPLGPVVQQWSGALVAPAPGLYELLFTPLPTLPKLIIRNIPISPTGELTITISSAPGAPVELGMLNIGNSFPLFGFGNWGGTEFGAEVEPTSNSYIRRYPDGRRQIVRRHSGTGMRCVVRLPRSQADAVVMKIQSLLDLPISAIASDYPGFAGLNVFGLLSGVMRYESATVARLTATVEGSI